MQKLHNQNASVGGFMPIKKITDLKPVLTLVGGKVAYEDAGL